MAFADNCDTKEAKPHLKDFLFSCMVREKQDSQSYMDNEITIGNRILTNNWPVCGLIFRVNAIQLQSYDIIEPPGITRQQRTPANL